MRNINTKLIEFENKNDVILRGVLVRPEKEVQPSYVVLMMAGFERNASTETKFKALSDELSKRGIASFRFDIEGAGLSDGNFYNMTIESIYSDLIDAMKKLEELSFKDFSVVGHSLAGCAIALVLEKVSLEKIVLIAPALNQRDLLRYWSVVQNNSDKEINWQNFREYVDEKAIANEFERDFITKSHILNYKYRFDGLKSDFSSNFLHNANRSVLLVHGDADDKVPLESFSFDFQNRLIVKGGDHHLERPDMMKQWIPSAADFLSKI